jgi:hypothetical protein
MAYENVFILEALINLKRVLKDKEDIALIEGLYDKYDDPKIEIDFEYTERELQGAECALSNIYKGVYQEPELWDMPDPDDTTTWTLNEELEAKANFFDEEYKKLEKIYAFKKIRNKKINKSSFQKYDRLICICFKDELIQLMKKVWQYEEPETIY